MPTKTTWRVVMLAALALLSLPSTMAAQPPATERPVEGLAETTGAFYAISVRDLDSAVAWYQKHLGFEVVSRGENDHRKGALLERSGTLLELAEFEGAVAREALREGLESHQLHGIFKLGFTTENLDQTFEHLVAGGAEVFFPIVSASDDRRTFGIKDSEGNIVQFFGE